MTSSNLILVFKDRSLVFPHPGRFLNTDPWRAYDLYAEAPWFHPLSVQDTQFPRNYTDGADMLLGSIPVWATYTEDWRLRMAVVTSSLTSVGQGSHAMRVTRRRFIKSIYKRMSLTPCAVPIPSYYYFDTWWYRIAEEVEYGSRLSRLLNESDSPLGSYKSAQLSTAVSQEMVFWTEPILQRDFGYVKKRTLPFFKTVSSERRHRMRLGYLIPYQMVEASPFRTDQLSSRYTSVPTWFKRIEVPMGCWVEYGSSLTYIGACLMKNPNHIGWNVFVTEWAVNVAAYILWDVYNTCRLWCLPPTHRDHILSLDMTNLLGRKKNNDEVKRLVLLMSQTDWSKVDGSNKCRSSLRGNKSPGRITDAGDFIWFNPWKASKITRIEALELRKTARPITETTVNGSSVTHSDNMDVDMPTDGAPLTEVAHMAAGTEVDDYIEEGSPADARDAETSNQDTLIESSSLEAMNELVRSLGVPEEKVGSSTKDLVEQIKIALYKDKRTRVIAKSSSTSLSAGSGGRGTEDTSPGEDHAAA